MRTRALLTGGLMAIAALTILGSCDDNRRQSGRAGQPITGELSDLYKAPDTDRPRKCRKLTGEVRDRVESCLSAVGAPALSQTATERVENIAAQGDVLMAAGRANYRGRQTLLSERTEFLDLALATDEEALATALREANFRGLVVHRDLDGALDRDSVVLSRLARHDFLEWFQLRHVTEDAYIYTVRTSAMRLKTTTGDAMLAYLRARLSGESAPAVSWDPKAARLLGTLRLQGNTLVVRHVMADKKGGLPLTQALDMLAGKLIRRWERDVEIEGHGSLRSRLDDVRLELHVIMEEAIVEPRTAWQIFDIWELGRDGMLFKQRKGISEEKFTYMPGSEAITRAHKSPDAFLRFAVEWFGWNDRRPWQKDTRTRLELIRGEHFMESRAGGGPAVRMVRGMPEESMAGLTDESIRQMLVDGGEWWIHNMRSDGSINYKYWPEQNRLSDDYNEVRHILATRDLADTFRYKRDRRYLTGAQLAMGWLNRYAIEDTTPVAQPLKTTNGTLELPHPAPGTMLFRYPGYFDTVRRKKLPNQKLGTVAVGLLGWVAYAQASGDTSQDEKIRKMAKYVLTQLEDTGKFNPYNVPRNHPYYGQKNDIVPGEAALALGVVAEYFGETDWLTFMPKFLDYYETWWNERAPQTQDWGRWPHDTYRNETRLDLVQFGPWAVMATKQYYLLTQDERAASFGLQIADWMIDSYQYTQERTPFPEFVGGYYKMPTELPAMQSFCYSEGTAAAYHIASTFAVDRKGKYDTSTREALRFLKVMQYDDIDSYFAARPKLIRGGVKYAMNQNKVRTDYVGHGLSTVSQYLDARRADPAIDLELSDLAGSTAAEIAAAGESQAPTAIGGEGDAIDEGTD